MGKISGPLLDRIDIHIDIPAIKYKEPKVTVTFSDASEWVSPKVTVTLTKGGKILTWNF